MKKLTYCYPVLDLSRYTIWPGCGFLDPQYLAAEKSQHPGVDWNGHDGGDTDLRDPVYSLTDGRVTYMGDHRYIGKILIIEFDDGSEGAYWHLDQFEPGLKVGSRTHMGQRVGTIGKGGTSPQYPKGRFAAHLHFEWRKKAGQCAPDEWPGVAPSAAAAATYIQATRYDPAARLQELGALTTLADVQSHYAAQKVKSDPAPNRRVMVETAPDTWQDVTGQRLELTGVTVNATDPGTIWIRPTGNMDTTTKHV